MKLILLVRKSLVALACVTFALGASAKAAENQSEDKGKNRRATHHLESTAKPITILVEVTGSRIPQRVVVQGQQVNSASPLFVIAGDELMRAGATSVAGMLAMDPSITFGGSRR